MKGVKIEKSENKNDFKRRIININQNLSLKKNYFN